MKSSKNPVRLASTETPGPSPAFEDTEDDLEQGYAAIALFAGIVAVIIASAGYLCRQGFAENSTLGWANDVGVSWFLVHFSFAVRQVLRRLAVAVRNHWWTSHTTITLFALTLVAICGVEQPAVVRIARTLFVLLGATAMAWRLFSRSRTARLGDNSLLWGFAAFFGLYAIGASWGCGLQNPDFVESLCFGRVPIDTLYHATLANMLRTYGVPSTGLDGLPYVLYHFGSHWLFGRLCNLQEVPVIDFYNRGYAVIFVPFGVFCLGSFALSVSSRWRAIRDLSESKSNLKTSAPLKLSERNWVIGPMFWFVLTAVYVGFLPYSSGFLTMVGWNSSIISESYGLAIAVSLLGISAVLSFFSDSRDVYQHLDLWITDRVLGIIVFSVVMGAIGLLKISVMLVLIAAAAFLFLRILRRMVRRATPAMMLVMSVVVVGCALAFTANPEYGVRSGFVPFGFLRENVDPQWWPYFWLVYYAWSWLYAGVRLREDRIRTLWDLGTAVREGRLLDLEFVVAIAVIGAGPGIVLTGDSNTHYFSEYQHWIAAGLLLAALLRAPGQPVTGESPKSLSGGSKTLSGGRWSERLTLSRIFSGVAVVAVAGTMVSNTLVLLDGTATTALASRGLAFDDADTRAKLLDRGFAEFCRNVVDESAATERHFDTDKNVLAVLRSLDRLPFSEKRRSLLYIPKSNTHYWGLLHGPYSPKDGPFVATALAGVAMIDGLYVRPEGDLWAGYGYQHYPIPIKTVERPPLDQYLPLLKDRCAKLGFTQLIVLTSDQNGVSKAQKYDCP